jgi:hypothetical protein
MTTKKDDIKESDEKSNGKNPFSKITQVKLWDGSIGFHAKTPDGQHLFFKNINVVNRWMVGLLIFILLTALLANYYVATIVTEGANRVLTKLETMSPSYPGYMLVEDPGYTELYVPESPP